MGNQLQYRAAKRKFSISKEEQQWKGWTSSPYARLARMDRPIGSLLLLYPTLMGTWMACPDPLTGLLLSGWFAFGAVVMRGAGCTINDMWDRNLDKHVERTKNRPLASGELSMKQAIGFLGLQLSGGALVLFSLKPIAVLIGLPALALLSIYPSMKRLTNYPQAFLGLTMNWGVFIGYASVAGALNWNIVLPLYAACWGWTMVYDTIYGHMDKEDDVKIGIKSTALKFGESTKSILFWYIGFIIFCLGLIALQNSFLRKENWALLIYLMSVGLFFNQLHKQVHRVNLNNPKSCLVEFQKHAKIGLILVVGIFATSIFRHWFDAKGIQIQRKESRWSPIESFLQRRQIEEL